MSQHLVSIEWRRDEGDADADAYRAGRYSRQHAWQFDGGISLPASASPHIVPPPYSASAAVDPEEAFVASLSSCHMLWFLSIAAEEGLVVDRYDDTAEGTLALNDDGQLAMTLVVLRPRVVFSGPRQPSRFEQLTLHERAHRACFIAQSVRSEVRCEPVDE